MNLKTKSDCISAGPLHKLRRPLCYIGRLHPGRAGGDTLSHKFIFALASPGQSVSTTAAQSMASQLAMATAEKS